MKSKKTRVHRKNKRFRKNEIVPGTRTGSARRRRRHSDQINPFLEQIHGGRSGVENITSGVRSMPSSFQQSYSYSTQPVYSSGIGIGSPSPAAFSNISNVSSSTASFPLASYASRGTSMAAAAAAAAASASSAAPTVNSIVFETLQNIYTRMSQFCMEGYKMITTTLWVSFLSKLPDLARSSSDLVKDASNAYYLYRYAMSIEIAHMRPAPSSELQDRFVKARDTLGKMLMTINNSGLIIRIFGIAYAKMNGRTSDYKREVDALAEIYKYDESVPRLSWKTMDLANLIMFADWYRYEIVILVGNLNSILIELMGFTNPKIPTSLPPGSTDAPFFTRELRSIPNRNFTNRLTPNVMKRIQSVKSKMGHLGPKLKSE